MHPESGDFANGFGVGKAAGMRCLKRYGSGRTDEYSDSSDRRGRVNPVGPVLDSSAIGDERMQSSVEREVKNDDSAVCLRGPRAQLGKIANDEYGRSDSARRRADASAESEHVKPHACRLLHHGRFSAPNPVGNGHRFGVDVLKAVLFHLGDYPVDCPFQVL